MLVRTKGSSSKASNSLISFARTLNCAVEWRAVSGAAAHDWQLILLVDNMPALKSHRSIRRFNLYVCL